MRGRLRKEKPHQVISEDESVNHTGQTPHANPSAPTFDEYKCSGNVEIDFPALCNLLDIKSSPAVRIKGLVHTSDKKPDDGSTNTNAAPSWSKQCLEVELENEDPLQAKSLKIFGWKVDDHIIKILQKMLPSLSKLQKIEFSLAGLTDQAVTSLLNTVPLCANLCFLTVEGNPLSEQSYQLLLSETSSLTHLCLKNNRMGDEGARLIGSALSTASSTNKKLLALNLSFNSIGDEGATHIAQGLRLNRTLLCLSLSNNRIGDAGATNLAQTLGEFALTHEEAEERTKLMGRKPAEPVEIMSPLLDTQIQLRDGDLIMPGNTTLVSLNLSGNKITEKSLPVFLKSLKVQKEGGGLLRLCLQRNCFSPGCDDYAKIMEVMAPREDAFEKLICEETDKMKKEA